MATLTKSEEKHVMDIAKWVAVTYGVEAIKDMAENLPKYIEEYNEAFAAFVVKMQNNKELEGIKGMAAAQVYAEINSK